VSQTAKDLSEIVKISNKNVACQNVLEIVRSLMKLYNPHALDLTIANVWVLSSS